MSGPEDLTPEAPPAGDAAGPPPAAPEGPAPSPAEVRAAIDALEHLAANRRLLAALGREERRRLIVAAGHVFNPDRAARRTLVKEISRARKEAAARRADRVMERTGIRELRRRPLYTTPDYLPPADGTPAEVAPAPEAPGSTPVPDEQQNCYVCKRDYARVHDFYDQLCPECAEFNYRKRTELADLRGRVALVTGARVKIGYQAGLKLLRCGARLIVTTRFPRDAAARYSREPDFGEWQDRLEIFGLDLRHTPSVEAFCRHLLATRDRLDYVVNNACQTVRRPPDYYEHMMAGETSVLHDAPPEVRRLLGTYEGLRGYHLLPEGGNGAALPAATDRALAEIAGLTHAAALSQVRLLPEERRAQKDLFPEGRLDADLQQVDLRERNSWRLLLHEVSSVELLEVQLVNAVAPFVLNARLKPLMTRAPERDKHVVNVSAMEGQFYRKAKTTRHPHTNMAKAALNMMTRTSAADYHHDGIHMNSVDTGWVTDEDPAAVAERKAVEHRFTPPLDTVDGAARIVDPIISGANTGVHVWGQFLKDYRPVAW